MAGIQRGYPLEMPSGDYLPELKEPPLPGEFAVLTAHRAAAMTDPANAARLPAYHCAMTWTKEK